MARIAGSVRQCWKSTERSRVAQLFFAVALTFAARPAIAGNEPVSIAHSDASLSDVVERLSTELTSDGYTVRLSAPGERSPCESPSQDKAGNPPDGGGAWIVVTRDANDPEVVIAAICFRSAVTLLQRVSARGQRLEPERFALTTAEALNGLSAQVPWIVPQAAREAPKSRQVPSPPPAKRPSRDALAVAQSALIDAEGVAPIWGGELLLTMATSRRLALQLEAFLPVTAAELANDAVSLRARSSFIRLGPSFHAPLGTVSAQFSLLAGPALTWATAEARPPRLGAADVALSAMVALGASLQYPDDSTVFVLGAAHLSALFPAVRLALADDASHALGPLLFEGSLGLGVRWDAGAE